MSALHVTILSTGEELVGGETPDTNACFLARELTAHGFRVRRIVTVGDDGAVLQEELLRAAADCELIVVSGGLGPTADDRTRKAIAGAAGRELVPDRESLEHVRRIMESHGHRMSGAPAGQAYFPEGSEIFANPRGTARGFSCPLGKATVVAMPGVPEEMRAVFREGVLPRLLRKPGERVVVRSVNLFGMTESEVDGRIGDLMRGERNPSVGPKVEGGVVRVCLRARGESAEQAQELLARDVETIRERFGDAAFGCDDVTLARALSELLEELGLKVSVAESCTGGLIGSFLTDVPGISHFFLEDVVAYSNECKVSRLGVPVEEIESFGAVSPQVAQSMARGVCRTSGAALGISTTGIAGPSGGTPEKPVGLVYVGISLLGRTGAHRLRLRGGRRRIKDRAAKHALNFARLALLRRARGEATGDAQA